MIILQTALCNLKDEILLSGYFNRFYEYAEPIERTDVGRIQTIPQVYIGNGEYKPIHDLDVNGTGYIRKNGESYSSIVSERVNVVSCSDTNPLIDLTIPLRCVAFVPKSALDDNAFSDDKLAFDLISVIGKKQAGVNQAVSIHGRVSGYKTDRSRIWDEEVKGIDKLIDLNLSVVAIDFALIIRANLDCLPVNCDY